MAIPVPRKRAISGKTILSPKSLLKKNILNMILMGTIPNTGIVHLINFNTFPNFLISPVNRSTSGLGKQLVQNASLPLPKATCNLTPLGSCPYFLKKLKVCLKMGEPPWTPSFIHEVPYFSLSMEMEVAWPPTTPIRSMMVTWNFSGCWARVAAQDLLG